MEVDEKALVWLMTSELSQPMRGQAYIGHVSDTSKSKEKGKEKAWEPSSNMESDGQLVHLLQCLHNVGVLENIEISILEDLIVQVLNKYEIVKQQCDEAYKGLYSALRVRKQTASPEDKPL